VFRSILIRLGLATTDREGEASVTEYTKRMREIREALREIEEDTERLGELVDSFVKDGDELREDEILSTMRSIRDAYEEVNLRADALSDEVRGETRREVRSAMGSGSSDSAEEFRDEWERLGSAWSSLYPYHDGFGDCSHGAVVDKMERVKERASGSVAERETQIEIFKQRPKEYIKKVESGDGGCQDKD